MSFSDSSENLVAFSSSTFYFGTDQIWKDYQNFWVYLCLFKPSSQNQFVFILNAVLDIAPLHSTICYTTTMGVARAPGPWFPKYIIFIICPQFCQFYKNVVLWLSEHGHDVIKTQTIKVCSPKAKVWFLICQKLGQNLKKFEQRSFDTF